METKGKKVKAVTGLKSMFRALQHRNYRLFFCGQSLSLIGTWMQRIALSWLVYRLTNSPFLLGIIGFSGQIPTFLLAPFAGILADQWNKKRMVLMTQSLATVQAFILAFLILTGIVSIWHLVVLSIFLGIINAFDIPTRQAFLLEMVEEKEDLGNSIALNSSMVTGARLFGPSIAGMLIALVGEGICFLINGISYLAVIAALLAMKISPKTSNPSRSRVLAGMKEGFAYAFGFAPIRAILLLLALVSLMGMPYVVLMPVFAKNTLHGGPHALGFLMGAAGLGALVGAVYLASRKTVLGLGKMILLAACIFGIGLICFSFSRVLWLSLIFMVMTGFGQMIQMASSNTILQTIVDDDKRGRVMSFFAMSFMGMTPFGSLLAGYLAGKIGAPATVSIGGIACLLGAAIFGIKLPKLREMVRPIYIRMGIIPEIALGIQSATEISAFDKDRQQAPRRP
jgi:MFS family permease